MLARFRRGQVESLDNPDPRPEERLTRLDAIRIEPPTGR
ncbi:MAG: hypothetical protein AVDCRST_MAG55-3288 [uncultured Rubrobacteraceae bacterium]|uniref:Uncharacterized protein n=1 Tax=uncultured Rubrobacteraceae bacterium TaxID=349277 RepID=A0A6J4QJM4_9ACTN|nr:MAG: hypothetical protein AVDCRST_MAG55-3288 [uncultured Rubrobacteraceae bacterium]